MNVASYINKIENIQFYLLVAAIATLPFSLVSNPFLFAIPIVALFGFNFAEKWNTLKTNGALPLLACTTFFFLMETISYFYYGNLADAWINYSPKILLWALPIAILSLPFSLFTKKRIKILIYTYLIGCATYVLVTLGYGIMRAEQFQAFYYTIYTRLSLWKHPTFMAMMLLFSNVILYYRNYINEEKQPKWERAAILILLILQSFYIILLQSKAGLIAFAALMPFLFYHLYQKLSRRKFYVIILTCILGAVCCYQLIPEKYNRFTGMMNVLKNANSEQALSSTNYRVMAMSASIDAIKSNPILGVGYMGAQDQLAAVASSNDLSTELRPHNQYLQTTMQLGIIGLIALLAILVSIPYCCKQQQMTRYFAATFVLLFAIVSLFESSWEGITMVSYSSAIIPLIILLSPKNKINEASATKKTLILQQK